MRRVATQLGRRSRIERGFSLVELMVVMTTIAVIAAIILLIAPGLRNAHRSSATENLFRLLDDSMESFAAEAPLNAVYNRRFAGWFGPYAPYTLPEDSYANDAKLPGWFVEGRFFGASDPTLDEPDTALRERVAWNLSGRGDLSASDQQEWIRLPDPGDPTDAADRRSRLRFVSDDDNRALYIYFKAFSPGLLEAIPPGNLERRWGDLDDDSRAERVNPVGGGTDPSDAGAFDVFTFVDAWGVPIDYFLHVKIGFIENSRTGEAAVGVVDREPVFRSRGARPERVEALLDGKDDWLFSRPLRRPYMKVGDPLDPDDGVYRGKLNGQGPQPEDGWIRAKAAEEDYGYLPDGDPVDRGA